MSPWQTTQMGGDGRYERLQLLGSFGLDFDHEFSYLEFPYPDGRDESLLTGNPDGVVRARLVYNVLPQSQDQHVVWQGEAVSEAEYVYKFFLKHMTPAKKPFILPHPMTRQDLLWVFDVNKVGFKLFAAYLWESGLPLRQFIGESVTDSSENPNTI